MLRENIDSLDLSLARSLKSKFDEVKVNNPTHAHGAVEALRALEEMVNDPEISALAGWTTGIAALQLDGQAEAAIEKLDEAATRFGHLGQPLLAAATQINKLHALTLLGRYKEALDCGLRARAVFLAHGDELGAGQIEQNIGNIYFRRDRYQEAEDFYRTARKRFAAVDDHKQLVQIDTCLGVALIYQHKFRDAALFSARALERAEAAGQVLAQAAIVCNLGCLALFQGRYDQALNHLERSRRLYESLGMLHESAIAEQELADAYLELNLAPEAAAMYARAVPVFAELGMRAEQARALAYHGRAALLLGRTNEAGALLNEARALYAAEMNTVGEAVVTLAEAQLYHLEGNYTLSAEAASRAEGRLLESGNWERLLTARWLCGESARAQGNHRHARSLLIDTLRDAKLHALPQIEQRCHTSLGLLASEAGELKSAEASFKRAIALIEDLRALLPSDEFRTAFVTDKLAPYTEMVRLCLAYGTTELAVEALSYVERSRSRALLDMLSGAVQFRPNPRDKFESGLLTRLEELREELSWFYTRIDEAPNNKASKSAEAIAPLREAVRERESTVLEITRQLQHRNAGNLNQVEPLDIERLRLDLGAESALVEYFSLDGEFLAFVVTDEKTEVIRALGSEEEVARALEGLRFQINSLRLGADRVRRHMDQLTGRARHHLGTLYDLLLRPIEERIGARRLVLVPHRALHYVPFHALYDGAGYVIERREVSYVPSASVLRHCIARPRRALSQALLIGVPDERAPLVRDEVLALAPLFPEASVLLGEAATLEALRERANTTDLLHLACHGQFRSDNPLFSALHLTDGWLTVGDAYKLDLSCQLVTLSACETGISDVAPGDELMGLARGFFSAGAPSLLVTLWTVDDKETAALMTDFYKRLLSGDAPAAALRYAQCQMLKGRPHPFFWSPFILLGRW
ncbi:MAG TPA: CHAT domain-containing tetratricopeptide repeat protein [Blastocatellia bacterium]|nr:CHAT domain-containing tetratricopeptide repeat protein [Blastocatellia bacterium]